MKKFNGQSIIGAVLLLLLAALLSVAPSRAAVLADLTDAELANVTGQSGITIWTSGSARVTMDVVGFTDSSLSHSLELHNIVVGDSSLSWNNDGGYFSWSTPLDLSPWLLDPAHDPLAITSKPVTIDVVTTAAGQTLVVSQESTHVSPRWYSIGYWDPNHIADPDGGLVGGLVFCNDYPTCSANYPLGTLNLDALSVGPSLQRYGSHADGTMGIDFDYNTIISAEALRYTYNSSLEALSLNGIHLTDNTVTGYDPTNPGTWDYTTAGNFKIGDIDAGHPATIDVDTDIAGNVSLHLNLPMQGTLRVEDVTFGSGNSFGPLAIDGINVHHLNVKISAWP